MLPQVAGGTVEGGGAEIPELLPGNLLLGIVMSGQIFPKGLRFRAQNSTRGHGWVLG